jgi:DNA-binding response OmpR family regulator
MILQMDGHDVRICSDGESALHETDSFIPDMVLLDIELPGLNGYEVAKRLRGKLWDDSVTLVAITGWGRDQDKQAAIEAGFDHHFIKPMDIDALTTLLTR